MTTDSKPTRRRRTLVAFAAMLLILAACGGGWSNGDENNVRKKLCDEQYSLATDSRKCDCVIKMVEKYFATADEFYDSTSPPEGFMSDLQSCGSA